MALLLLEQPDFSNDFFMGQHSLLIKEKRQQVLIIVYSLASYIHVSCQLNIHSYGKRRSPASTINRLSNWRMLRSLLFRVLSYST
jgi:hypothetical protein